jgi:poly-gamma-glutamate capsule biosynthesis protein CapA/YwtB (metallophosphatase superfamily)
MDVMRRLAPLVIVCALGASSAPAGLEQSAPSDATVSVALTGDSILMRRLSVYQEPEYLSLMSLIRGADAAFTNLETLFHDFEAPPAHESGGTWMHSEPAIVKELTWAGFDLVSRANNHAGDFGPEGMLLTSRYVTAAGLVEAGVGRSLAEAREARFLETPRARLALISAASTFPPHSRAGNTRGDMPPRPGLNPLRFTTTYVVTPPRLEELKRAAAEVTGRPAAPGDRLTFVGRQFVAGPTPRIRTEPNKTDLDAIAAVVKSAATLADLVIVSLHCHESGADRTAPADFIPVFARAVIDAGADMFVGHGPHLLRGIEIYKGKSIFYSLGDFIFQNETLVRFPAESYEEQELGADAQPNDYLNRRYDNDRRSFPADREAWESVVALARWRGEQLAEITLHPVTLGFGQPRAVRGRPMMASSEDATRILGMLGERSKPFGTTMTVRDGVGHIEVARPSTQD